MDTQTTGPELRRRQGFDTDLDDDHRTECGLDEHYERAVTSNKAVSVLSISYPDQIIPITLRFEIDIRNGALRIWKLSR